MQGWFIPNILPYTPNSKLSKPYSSRWGKHHIKGPDKIDFLGFANHIPLCHTFLFSCFRLYFQKHKTQASEIAQQVKASTAKPDDLSLIRRIHVIEEKLP